MPDGHGLAGWAGGVAWSGAGAGLGRTLISRFRQTAAGRSDAGASAAALCRLPWWSVGAF